MPGGTGMYEFEDEQTNPQLVACGLAPGIDEQRRFLRYDVKLDLTLLSEPNFYSGFTENLSIGGVFVATHLLKRVGSLVDVRIVLPSIENDIRGLGEVRWQRRFDELNHARSGMGIRFVDLDPGSVEAIHEFLSRREPMFF